MKKKPPPKALSERDIKASIMLRIGAVDGIRLFKNTVGLLYTRNGTPTRVGLAVGSSDLIGWRRIKITPEMVGASVAVFLAIETKSKREKNRKTKTSEDQGKFIDAVRRHGGIALKAHSEVEVEGLADEWRARLIVMIGQHASGGGAGPISGVVDGEDRLQGDRPAGPADAADTGAAVVSGRAARRRRLGSSQPK